MLPADGRLILDELCVGCVEVKCIDWVGEEKMPKVRHEKETEVWCRMKACQFFAEVRYFVGEPGNACRTS